MDKRLIKKLAKGLRVEVAAVEAVIAVESGKKGFDEKGLMVILFETHVLYRELTKAGLIEERDKLVAKGLATEKWTRNYPATLRGRWDQIKEVIRYVDLEYALRSTSMGLFQIMGFNYAACGFKSAVDMASYLARGEEEQTKVFAKFISNNPRMLRALQGKDWKNFAYFYNGAGYEKNNYDVKLSVAYARARGDSRDLSIGDKGPEVKWLQDRLNQHGFDLEVDGVFGRKTFDAVRRFQMGNDLGPSGVADAKTKGKLT